MGTGDDNRPTPTGIAEWLTKIGISLVTAAAIFGASRAWDIDRTVLNHDLQLKYIIERQDGLRKALRCDPVEDPHPICARIERLGMALKLYHKE